jgi:GNAT superfamily N-acetyltransferase
MTTVAIDRFQPGDEGEVTALILSIQRDEFGFAVTAEDQPDLAAIPAFYQVGRGDFYVARDAGRIVGTISLKDIGEARGALRKMFVAPAWRGRERGVAARLLSRLLDDARAMGVVGVWLGTTDRYHAAHRFYEKNGFLEVAKSILPPGFPLMALDNKFYALGLVGPGPGV